MRSFLIFFGLTVHLPFLLSGWNTSEETTTSEAQPETALIMDADEDILTAAQQIYKYERFLKGKNLAMVVNHTSMVDEETHLVDALLEKGHSIKKIFAPEHGFRGTADAGERIESKTDKKTGIPIISLYGRNKKPSQEQLADVDLVIFDIQDVGARFYTYTSTMTYVMEACAEYDVPLLVLDRPNPNGHYVDGPILEEDQESFIGMHPVPIVHGLTVAEYAHMINGEGWLKDGIQCDLHHVECLNYNHQKFYELPIPPSPNLPNPHSIYLYPSLCLFEGTNVSVGRGTNQQFQIYGSPDFKSGDYNFTPKPGAGSKNPLHNGKKCNGFDLTLIPKKELTQNQQLKLSYILNYYQQLSSDKRSKFFRTDGFFNLLSGNTTLKKQIQENKSEEEIRASWEPALTEYKEIRKKYLLYKE